MDWLLLLAGIVSVLLAVYLVAAVLFAEKF